MWGLCLRIRGNVPSELADRLDGKTHVCVAPVPGGVCNMPLKLSKRDGRWSTSHGLPHYGKYHPETKPGKEYNERQQKAHAERVQTQLLYEHPTKGKTTLDSGAPLAAAFANFKLQPEQRALSTQAMYVVYGNCHISERTLEDMYYKDMLGGTSPDGCVAYLSIKNLEKFVDAEWEVFVLFFKYLLDQCSEEALGNAFGQFIHDGGTLKNGKKYQAFALQLIDPQFLANLTVCFAFPRVTSSTDIETASTAYDVMQTKYGHDLLKVAGSARQDAAALGVARQLGLEEEICTMHCGDKVGSSAVSDLVRTRSKQPVNAHPGLQAFMKNAQAMATHFSYGNRYDVMFQLAEQANVPFASNKMQIDKNGTRVAARHNLLGSQIPLCNALPIYHAAKSKVEDLKWTAEPTRFTDTAQIESVLHVTQVTTKLAQYEQAYSGAYDPLIKGKTIRGLESEKIAVADLNNIGKTATLNRIWVEVKSFGSLGKAAHVRAMIEAQRRFCVGAEKTETVIVPTPDIACSDRSLVAMLLDLRTCSGNHLSKKQLQYAKEQYYTAYVEFAKQAKAFKQAKQAEWERRAAEQAEAAAVEAAASGATSTSQGSAAESKFTSPTAYGGRIHSSSEDEVPPASTSQAGSLSQVSQEEMTDVSEEDGYLIEAKRVLKTWRNLDVDWRKEFPAAKLPDVPTPLECVTAFRIPLVATPPLTVCALCCGNSVVDDLMDLPIGDLYTKIIGSDENSRLYGHIPLMAKSSPYQIGALNAESFCERVLRCAGHIVTDGNTLLGDTKIEKLTILRMNRAFMVHMRKHYSHVVKDTLTRQFGMSIVENA
jgi:hypothetical protein